MLKFGIPYALNTSAYWFLTSYSKSIISSSLGTYYNGLYAVATKFTAILSVFSTSILMVWQEISFSKYEEIKENKEKVGEYYSVSNKYTLYFIIYCAAFLLPLIRIIFPIIIDNSYSDAISIIPLAIIAMIVNVYCMYLTSIFTAIKKNRDMLISSIFGAIVNVIFANIFVKYWAIDGVNIAMIVGLLINAVIRIFLLYKRIGFKNDFKKCLIPSILVISAYFIFIKFEVFYNAIFMLFVAIVLFFDFKGKIKTLKQGKEL